MADISLGNRLFRQLIALSFWHRIALTASVLCGTFFCWFFFIYVPIANNILNYQQQIFTITGQAKNINTLRQQCCHLEQEIAKENTQLSANQLLAKESHHFLPLLAQQAKKSSFCLDNGSVDDSTQGQALISFSGTGSMSQIMAMVEDCCAINGLLTLEKIALNLAKPGIYQASVSLVLAKNE